MRILFVSVPFRPSVGGIETVSALLAERFARAGHEVCVVTRTLSPQPDPPAPYRLLRRPDAATLWRESRRAHVVLHNNVSLRAAWPQLAPGRRPWVIAHHMWTPRAGRGALAGRAKHAALRFATNVAVSAAMARTLAVPANVIGNPWNDALFGPRPHVSRDRDLVYLGRLLPGKGVHRLLEAVAALQARGRSATLTVIGGGPQDAKLRALARTLGIAQLVHFAGVRTGDELVDLLNGHRVLVVPSTDPEPFGVVVLEGLACGLLPVVADCGGLPDAAGPCGLVVPPDSAVALSAALERALADDATTRALRAAAPAQLAAHAPDAIAARYLEVLAAAVAAAARAGVRPARAGALR